MSKQKVHLGRFELLRVLSDRNPDETFHIRDADWGSGYVECYLWETLETRTLAKSDVVTDAANLVKKGLVKFVTVQPKLLQRLFGAQPVDYAYLTPTGHDAANNPTQLLEPLDRDDYDRRYEPKGMWLRQIEGLPPLSD